MNNNIFLPVRYFAITDCIDKEHYKEDPVFFVNNNKEDAQINKYSNVNEIIEFCMNILIDIHGSEYSEEIHVLAADNNKVIIDNISDHDIYQIIALYSVDKRQKMLAYLKNTYGGRIAYNLYNAILQNLNND